MMMVMTIIIITLYNNGIFLQHLYFDFAEHHLETMVKKGEQISARKVTLGCETAEAGC